MNWPRLPRPRRTHWIVVMAGREVLLALRQALPGRWFRILGTGSPYEMDQRLRIIVPSLVILEVSSRLADPVKVLQEFHRSHPLVPSIAILDEPLREMAPRIAEQATCQALVKPFTMKQLKAAVQTELPDASLPQRIGAAR